MNSLERETPLRGKKRNEFRSTAQGAHGQLSSTRARGPRSRTELPDRSAGHAGRVADGWRVVIAERWPTRKKMQNNPNRRPSSNITLQPAPASLARRCRDQ